MMVTSEDVVGRINATVSAKGLHSAWHIVTLNNWELVFNAHLTRARRIPKELHILAI